MAVVAIKGGMEEMVGWIDRIECCFCFLFFIFVTKMKSTIFFDTVAYCQYQYYSSWERDGKKTISRIRYFWCVPRCK